MSFYEIAIKQNIDKLIIDKSVLQFYMDTLADNIKLLPIATTYLASLSSLPIMPNHKDPFDRLIIATAITDNLIIVSIDSKFELYKELVTIIW